MQQHRVHQTGGGVMLRKGLSMQPEAATKNFAVHYQVKKMERQYSIRMLFGVGSVGFDNIICIA